MMDRPIEGLDAATAQRLAAILASRRTAMETAVTDAVCQACDFSDANLERLAVAVKAVAYRELKRMKAWLPAMDPAERAQLGWGILRVHAALRSAADAAIAHPDGGVYVDGLLIAADWALLELAAEGLEPAYLARLERPDCRSVFAVGVRP